MGVGRASEGQRGEMFGKEAHSPFQVALRSIKTRVSFSDPQGRTLDKLSLSVTTDAIMRATYQQACRVYRRLSVSPADREASRLRDKPQAQWRLLEPP
jgi:hypothetical protein